MDTTYTKKTTDIKFQPVLAPSWRDLDKAVHCGDIETVKRLVSEGLAADTTNQKGETAAHFAAIKGKLAILEYLLSEKESLLRAKDKIGQNILHLAAANGHTEIVKYLVDNCHVDIFHADNIRNNNSVVHVVASGGHMDLVKYFMEEKHVDPNVLNEKGESPAFLAAGNKQLPIIVYLVAKHNADLTMVDYKNRNILFPAAMKGDVTVPTYVLDQRKVKLDINWADNVGRTVLHWSVLSNYKKITEYFVDVKHAEVNLPDAMKQTPLHLVARAGHINLVQYLYEMGADPELPDAYGKTPSEIAKDKRVKEFFEEYPKKRHRRSAPQPGLADTLARGYSYSMNGPISYTWRRGISAGPSLWSNGHLEDGGHTNLQYTTTFPGLDGFIALANVLIGGKRSVNEDRSARPPNRVELLAADIADINLDDAIRD